jgi:hypothetical protein
LRADYTRLIRLQHYPHILFGEMGSPSWLHGQELRGSPLNPSHLSTPVDHLAGVAMPGDAGGVAMDEQ